jgi:hypothetical protein
MRSEDHASDEVGIRHVLIDGVVRKAADRCRAEYEKHTWRQAWYQVHLAARLLQQCAENPARSVLR